MTDGLEAAINITFIALMNKALKKGLRYENSEFYDMLKQLEGYDEAEAFHIGDRPVDSRKSFFIFVQGRKKQALALKCMGHYDIVDFHESPLKLRGFFHTEKDSVELKDGFNKLTYIHTLLSMAYGNRW
ncbi:hypothetical protein KY316_01840 [Candidatus Woesearchaeota archaeon]|nr:hypothetical protein [Candidatus Woesearchaeota archaeon]